jgi:hypothetical protein
VLELARSLEPDRAPAAATSALALPIAAEVHDDAEGPRREASALVEAREAAPDPDPRELAHVLRLAAVVEQPRRELDEAGIAALHELVEGGPFAGLRPARQIGRQRFVERHSVSARAMRTHLETNERAPAPSGNPARGNGQSGPAAPERASPRRAPRGWARS